MKKKLGAGGKVFGEMVGPGGEPEKIIRALKDLGDEFVLLDTEHSLMNKETVLEYVRVCHEMDMPLIMRTEDKAAFYRCYLDAGVNGLMLPLVNNVEETVYAIDRSYFPPIGHRGYSLGMSPYLIDSQNAAEVPVLKMTEYVNNNTMLFPQTESLENISNLPRIMGLDGVTGTIVGPFDLALNIGGIPAEARALDVVTSPAVEEKLQEIIEVCQATGKVAGIGGFPPQQLAKWAKAGYNLLLVGYIFRGEVDKLRPLIEESKSLIG
jgi:2-keto-3-deoxy-L-rhamnonate aldolase RhmA